MIEINLIPPTLRKKKKSEFSLAGLMVSLEAVIGLGAGLIVVLILVHVVLGVMNVGAMAQRKGLRKELEALSSHRQEADKVLGELKILQETESTMRDILPKQISWAQKLNILSDRIPNGMWLRRLWLENNVFSVEGSAITTNDEAMINVHKFFSDLKDQKEFQDEFNDMELGSIQRRKAGSIEIADFLITMELK